MVSIFKIQSNQIHTNNNTKLNQTNSKTHTRQDIQQDNNLLTAFLTALSNSNAASLSFGSGVGHARACYQEHNYVGVPADSEDISGDLKWKIQCEAVNHIRGNVKWPEINNINAWMVTAETQTFMPVGGLAQVGIDLPNSFNAKFGKVPGNKMPIVTPMYINESPNGTNKLSVERGKLFYTYKGEKIQISKTSTIKVPIFDEWKNGGDINHLEVGIYQGIHKGSRYIFMDRRDVFNIDPIKGHGTSNAYTLNKYGYSETIRFPFFIRCIYEYMKELKGNPNKYREDAPNVIIMNDWHAGSLAPMMKYLAPCEREKNEISEEVAQYMKETPTLFIAHNLAYQGDVWDDGENRNARAKVLGTIFGKFAKPIVENARGLDEHTIALGNNLPYDKRNALCGENGNINQGIMGLCLADRVVPVSENFGQELLTSPASAKGTIEILNERNEYGTFTPITNGYTKTRVQPSEAHIKDITDGIIKDAGIEDLNLTPYTVQDLEEIKPKNKVEIFKLVDKLLERERNMPEARWDSLVNATSDRRYIIYKPYETNLNGIDLNKVPVMTFVGRVVEQKGMHNIFKKAYLDFAKEYMEDKKKPEAERKYKNWEIPILVVGGTFNDADKGIYKALEDLKNELPKEFAERFVLFRGFCNTNLFAMGSDFFLIPSNFEPCGLVQMEAMAKGVVPIASAAGGLVSTIDQYKSGFLSTVHYDEAHQRVFKSPNNTKIPHENADGYKEALENALLTYFEKPNQMVKMQRTAMLKDFSWAKDDNSGALDKYVSLMKTGRLTKTDDVNTLPYNERPDAQNKIPYIVPDMECST